MALARREVGQGGGPAGQRPGQKVALGRLHKHQTVTESVPETSLAVELEDGVIRVIRCTTYPPFRSIRGQLPRTATVS